MKTNLILASAVLACANFSYAGTSGTSSSYGTGSSKPQGGTGVHPTQDSSQSVYDQAINPQRIDADRKATQSDIEKRISSEFTNQSNIDRATKETDGSGHKLDQAPSVRE